MLRRIAEPLIDTAAAVVLPDAVPKRLALG
jgi:hypothetical protein